MGDEIKLSEVSGSSLHWTPEEMLGQAIEWAREHPTTRRAYVVFVDVKGGVGYEDDVHRLTHFNAGLTDLEAVGALHIASITCSNRQEWRPGPEEPDEAG